MMKRLGKKDKIALPDPFEVSEAEGTIKRGEAGARILAIGSAGWATLEQELETTFVTGAAVILQRMGYSYGRYLGKVAKSKNIPPDGTFDALLDFSKQGGWGRMSLNSGDLIAGTAKIVVHGCFFCLHWRDSQSPVCHMLAGLVGGVADEIVGKAHRVLEERCIGKGDNVCEISIERVGV